MLQHLLNDVVPILIFYEILLASDDAVKNVCPLRLNAVFYHSLHGPAAVRMLREVFYGFDDFIDNGVKAAEIEGAQLIVPIVLGFLCKCGHDYDGFLDDVVAWRDKREHNRVINTVDEQMCWMESQLN